MTTFDKREEGFEKKFALDEEQKFKARRAGTGCSERGPAEKLGMTRRRGRPAYAKEVVAADFEEAGDDDVLRKVAKDLAAKGVARRPGRDPRQDERAAWPWPPRR